MKKSMHNLKRNLSTQATNSMDVYVSNFFDLSGADKASATYISAIHNAETALRASCGAAVQSVQTYRSDRRRKDNIDMLSKSFSPRQLLQDNANSII